jgi:hypothetical protein
MRMPRKAGEVIRRTVVPEIVEQEERIVFAGVAEAESSFLLDAGPLERRLCLHDLFHWPDGHIASLTELLIADCQSLI